MSSDALIDMASRELRIDDARCNIGVLLAPAGPHRTHTLLSFIHQHPRVGEQSYNETLLLHTPLPTVLCRIVNDYCQTDLQRLFATEWWVPRCRLAPVVEEPEEEEYDGEVDAGASVAMEEEAEEDNVESQPHDRDACATDLDVMITSELPRPRHLHVDRTVQQRQHWEMRPTQLQSTLWVVPHLLFRQYVQELQTMAPGVSRADVDTKRAVGNWLFEVSNSRRRLQEETQASRSTNSSSRTTHKVSAALVSGPLVVLCKDTMYRNLVTWSKTEKLQWQRVVFDGVDAVNIPACQMCPALFHWAVASTCNAVRRVRNTGFLRRAFGELPAPELNALLVGGGGIAPLGLLPPVHGNRPTRSFVVRCKTFDDHQRLARQLHPDTCSVLPPQRILSSTAEQLAIARFRRRVRERVPEHAALAQASVDLGLLEWAILDCSTAGSVATGRRIPVPPCASSTVDCRHLSGFYAVGVELYALGLCTRCSARLGDVSFRTRCCALPYCSRCASRVKACVWCLATAPHSAREDEDSKHQWLCRNSSAFDKRGGQFRNAHESRVATSSNSDCNNNNNDDDETADMDVSDDHPRQPRRRRRPRATACVTPARRRRYPSLVVASSSSSSSDPTPCPFIEPCSLNKTDAALRVVEHLSGNGSQSPPRVLVYVREQDAQMAIERGLMTRGIRFATLAAAGASTLQKRIELFSSRRSPVLFVQGQRNGENAVNLNGAADVLLWVNRPPDDDLKVEIVNLATQAGTAGGHGSSSTVSVYEFVS